MGTGTVIFIGVTAFVGLCVYSYCRRINQRTNNNSNLNARPSTKMVGTSEDTTQPPKKPINQVAARTAFLNNISKFAALLPSLENGTYSQKEVQSKWDDQVIDTNDWDLINMWQLVRKNPNSVKHIFAQWGLTPDLCTRFQCMDFHKGMYESTDGTLLENIKEYEVISPCWVLAETNIDGSIKKSVIYKGKVK